MQIAKAFSALSLISFVLLAVSGHVLFAGLGPVFLLLAMVKILADNREAFNRFMSRRIGSFKNWIVRVWKRYKMNRAKVLLINAIICLLVFAVSENLLFAWLSPFFLLLALVSALEDVEAVKQFFITPGGLRILLMLESICLVIMAVSTVRIYLFTHASFWHSSNAQALQLIDNRYLVPMSEFLFVFLPGSIAQACSKLIRNNEENPSIVELKSTPLWMIERVASRAPVVSLVLILGMVGYEIFF